MRATPPTVDELVASIKNSYVPTVLCEGSTDSTIFARLGFRLGVTRVAIQSCGGRSTLLAVHARRAEFPHKRIAFVADQDTFFFLGIPPAYSDIVFTAGYSIENDIYEGSEIEALLTPDERQNFDISLQCLIRWYAFEISRAMAGHDPLVDVHPNRVLNATWREIDPTYATSIAYSEPDTTFVKLIHSNYKLSLRGHVLFDHICGYLSDSGRPIKHSLKSLLEVCCVYNANPRIKALAARVNATLGIVP